MRLGHLVALHTADPEEPLVPDAAYISLPFVAVPVVQDAMQVQVALLTGAVYKVPCTAACTVADLKLVLQELTTYPASWQQLRFKREEIHDKETLASAGVADGDKLYLVCTFGRA